MTDGPTLDRPMTADERTVAMALQAHVEPGASLVTWNFIEDMAEAARVGTDITDRQGNSIMDLAWRYREVVAAKAPMAFEIVKRRRTAQGRG